MKICKFETPIVLRKEIIKKAAIKSGLIKEIDLELFEKFWKTYEILLSKYEKECVVVD